MVDLIRLKSLMTIIDSLINTIFLEREYRKATSQKDRFIHI